MNKLVLIDGNSLINRAFYATPPLSDRQGRPTNAVYGFMNMLIKIIGDIKPTHILVAFDRKEPTFRHKMYSEYKGTRKPMPEDLRPQIPLLKEVLDTLNICRYDQAGVEADDIIGTLAKKYDYETVIITGDKDSFQLVDNNTSVYFTKRGISDIDIYTSKNFKEKTGINPIQIIDLKSLMGDSSDNIIGIPGIGEKTALSLVEKYESLENIYNNLQDFTGKTLEKIVNGKESAFLSKTLATINTNVEIDVSFDQMKLTFPFSDKAKRLFTELEFRGLLRRNEIFDSAKNTETVEQIKQVPIVLIKNKEEISSILKNGEITLAIEENVNIYTNNTEYVIPIKQTFFDEGFNLIDVYNLLKPFLEDEGKTLICYSYKKLATILKEFDILINAKYQDVDVLRYLVDFSGKEESLKETIYYYNLDLNCLAYSLNLLYKRFVKSIEEENLSSLYYDIELPLCKVLFDMEQSGFKVDIDALNSVGLVYKKELDSLNAQINEMAGEQVNPNSPKQLGAILFDKLQLKKGKKNKNGGYSTGAEILEEMVDLHPIIPLILRYRTLQKLNSQYVDSFKDLIDKKTGLVHTCFNQTLTQTGRLSSKEPNLQNIPVRDEEGKELRKFFIPKNENGVLVDADYSQIELRLLAHFSGSQELIKAYNEGIDIQTLTASQVFNVKIEDVTPKMRREAKAVNFGIIYGISEYGLAKNIKTTPKQAREYIAKYFETYPRVKEYMNSNVEFARKNGYVSTLKNRKRYIKEINSPNYNLRLFGERAAMNMPLQGTSADIIKIAMVNVYNRLKKEGLKSKLILQVHDELIIDATFDEAEKVKDILKYEMENAVKLSVPLTVEVSVGKTWYDAK